MGIMKEQYLLNIFEEVDHFLKSWAHFKHALKYAVNPINFKDLKKNKGYTKSKAERKKDRERREAKRRREYAAIEAEYKRKKAEKAKKKKLKKIKKAAKKLEKALKKFTKDKRKKKSFKKLRKRYKKIAEAWEELGRLSSAHKEALTMAINVILKPYNDALKAEREAKVQQRFRNRRRGGYRRRYKAKR